jgi:hypothetical protein
MWRLFLRGFCKVRGQLTHADWDVLTETRADQDPRWRRHALTKTRADGDTRWRRYGSDLKIYAESARWNTWWSGDQHVTMRTAIYRSPVKSNRSGIRVNDHESQLAGWRWVTLRTVEESFDVIVNGDFTVLQRKIVAATLKCPQYARGTHKYADVEDGRYMRCPNRYVVQKGSCVQRWYVSLCVSIKIFDEELFICAGLGFVGCRLITDFICMRRILATQQVSVSEYVLVYAVTGYDWIR